MQFISISRRRTDAFTDAEFAPHIEAEREQVRQLYAYIREGAREAVKANNAQGH